MGESGGNEMEEVLVEELSQEESEVEIWQRREKVGREEEREVGIEWGNGQEEPEEANGIGILEGLGREGSWKKKSS